METKQFELRVLLTVTTGRLLTKGKGESDDGIDDLYKILAWMTGEDPFTHQLGRFSEECKPWLLRWFPELKRIEADAITFCDKLGDKLTKEQRNAAIEGLVWGLGERVGKHVYDVPKITQDDHSHRNAFDELADMLGELNRLMERMEDEKRLR